MLAATIISILTSSRLESMDQYGRSVVYWMSVLIPPTEYMYRLYIWPVMLFSCLPGWLH